MTLPLHYSESDGAATRSSVEGMLLHLPLRGDAVPRGMSRDLRVAGLTPTRDRFGVHGAAVAFDGVRSGIIVNDDDSLRPAHVTVAAWFHPRHWFDDAKRWAPLVDRMNAFVPDGFRVHVARDGVAAAVVTQGATATTELFEAPCRFVEGAWHHVTVTFDGSALRCYLNGQLVRGQVAESPGPLHYGTLHTPLAVGMRATGPTSRLAAMVQDVRVYGRALTAVEVGGLPHAG